MRKPWRFCGALGLAILAGCGGGDTQRVPLPPTREAAGPVLPACPTGTQPDCAPPLLRQALRATPSNLATADELFDWAERTFPQYFPSHRQTLPYAEYQYRFYPETGNYVGISGGSVFGLGPLTGGALTNLGDLTNFTCHAFPYRCNLLAATGGSTIDLAISGVGDLQGADVFIQEEGGTVLKLPPANADGTSFVVPFTPKSLDFRLAIYRNGQEAYGARLTISPGTSGSMLGHPAETFFRASLKLADEALIAARERGTPTSVAEAQLRRDDISAWLQFITRLRAGESFELARTPEGQAVFASAADLLVLDAAIIQFDKIAGQAFGVAPVAALRAPSLLADPTIDYGRFVGQMSTVEQIKLGGLAVAEAWELAGVGLTLAGAIGGSTALTALAVPVLTVGLGTALTVNVVSGLWKAYHADPNFAFREEVAAAVGALLPKVLGLDQIIYPLLVKARIRLIGTTITRLDASLLLGARPLVEWLTADLFKRALEGMVLSPRPPTPRTLALPGYYLYRIVDGFAVYNSCSSVCEGRNCRQITDVVYSHSVMNKWGASYTVLDWYTCPFIDTQDGVVVHSGTSSAYNEFHYCQAGRVCAP